MKNKLTNIFAIILMTICSWSTASYAKIRIVTTLPSFADIAANVGGDEIEVIPLLKGVQDPHFVDPRPDIILKLNRADLLIHAGLGLEDGWLPSLLTGSRNGKIQGTSEGNFDVSTLMRLKEILQGNINRAQGDVHPGGNPHYMLDPRNGIILAKALGERLGKIKPSKTEYFKGRAEMYSKDLLYRITAWEKTLSFLKERPVVTYHRSWVYFSNWIGLNIVGYVEPKPGVPPSPDHIAKLINLMKEKKTKLILMEHYYPKSSAQEVARQTGSTLFVLPTEVQGAPEIKTYISVFDEITKNLSTINR